MIINEKNYRIPDLNDFDTVIELESKGINLMWLIMDAQANFATAPFTTIRDVLACFMMSSKEEATAEIKEYVKNGGSIIELMDKMLDEISEIEKSGKNSGFSKAEKNAPQKKKANQNAQTSQKETQA